MISTTNPDYSNTPVSPARPSFGCVPREHNRAPRVTILTPFYNTGEVFHQTASSVMRQSFQEWEWIIVNDGSTHPEALRVLAGYRNSDPRIRIIEHGENRGPSAARNTGVREARSEYIAFVDSDDLLEPTAIEKWICFLESHPECSFVSGYSVGFGATEYLWSSGFHSGPEFLRQNMVNITSMIRTSVYRAVGGFDENIRRGLEDWEFWLRCAQNRYWGDTIPEYLNWYRRRKNHGDRWEHLDSNEQSRAASQEIRNRYAELQHSFPTVTYKPLEIYPRVQENTAFQNRLQKEKRRLLMILPWMTMGGADKFNLDLISQLKTLGWEITIATTLEGDNCWLPEFASMTPDIFILNHLLKVTDWPRFISYLIESRDIDNVLISNSDFAYSILPYLRARFPNLAFSDYCHMEEEYWKGGGYPRKAVEYQQLFDMNIVSSEHLKQWMVQRGAEADRISVCYTNIDSEVWKPLAESRRTIRRKYGIADDTPVILYAGRIHAQKQPKVFASTMLRLRDSGANFVALAAGDGPEFKWLQGFVREHRLQGHVRLLGALPNDKVKQLLQASDVFFLPSQMEGVSLAIYEAMASGVAIVGADVGGQIELVTSDCGILIQRSSEDVEIEIYASTLLKMLADPKKLRSMGEAGRRRIVEQFKLRDMGVRMHELLLQASDWNRSRPQPGVNRGVAQSTLSMSIDYTRIENLLRQVWQVYSWTQRNRTHLDLMFPGDKVPVIPAQTGLQQPSETGSLAKLQLMEDGIYNFFAHLPERALHAYLDDNIPRRSQLLGDIQVMRQRVLPSIARWQEQKSRVYIYGLGTHTQVLLGTCPALMPLVRGFIDKNAEEPFLGIPCVKPESINGDNADVIIYSSKRWEADMYANLAHLTTQEHVLMYSKPDEQPAAVPVHVAIPKPVVAGEVNYRYDDNLIYDMGVNKGEDTRFYLEKGFRVVGVEANPTIYRRLLHEFRDALNDGTFILLNVGVWKERGTLPFYANLDNDHWSSFSADHGCRHNTRFEVVNIPCITIQDLLAEYGVPRYMKIDLEGADKMIVNHLLDVSIKPKFISAEEYGVKALHDLHGAGYRAFKIVAQRDKTATIPPSPSKEGHYVYKTFTGYDSGLFGLELQGEWMSYEETVRHYTGAVRDTDGLYVGPEHEWYDIHAQL
ncbi:MAG: hypothetical protein AUI54_01070 [Acidobacteria bacterium 13_1_40CM_2_56_5]|nr:MAG: hypothetical protein AUI54_01070 [Acidobacteria bacterium 13_1_40CM_2_56_5]